jgi:hypothetical protein
VSSESRTKRHATRHALLTKITNDYDAKTAHEAAHLACNANRAAPETFGDPLSGVVLVAERATASAQLVDALRRSLAAVRLDRAYVTWSSPDLLEALLSLEPGALVAVGPEAVRAIDASGYPLAKRSFSEATEGSWFAWTKGASGLRLPALAPALEDAGAKRRFWRAFQALRALVPDRETPPPGS